MYAAGTGTTVEIVDAACEPHVRDLLDLLCDLGARIEGINTNRVTVNGGIDDDDGDRRLSGRPRTTWTFPASSSRPA